MEIEVRLWKEAGGRRKEEGGRRKEEGRKEEEGAELTQCRQIPHHPPGRQEPVPVLHRHRRAPGVWCSRSPDPRKKNPPELKRSIPRTPPLVKVGEKTKKK
jgi:hypothetical protein